MRPFLKQCIFEYKDEKLRSYFSYKTFTRATTLFDEIKIPPQYFTLSFTKEIGSSFLWLWYTIGGVLDPDVIPTEDNSIYWNTDRISPAFVIAEVEGKLPIPQRSPISTTSATLWKRMSFDEKIKVWYYIVDLKVRRELSFVAWWFRELFHSEDFPTHPHLEYKTIILEVVNSLPSYHLPPPKIKNGKPIRTNRFDQLYFGLGGELPISMKPILGEQKSSWKEASRNDYVLLSHGKKKELWPIKVIEERKGGLVDIILELEEQEDLDGITEGYLPSRVVGLLDDNKWSLGSHNTDRNFEGNLIDNVQFFKGTFTEKVSYANAHKFYIREVFTPDLTDRPEIFNHLGSDYPLRPQPIIGNIQFLAGEGKQMISGDLYTMINRSPMMKAAMEAGSLGELVIRFSPYFAYIWMYLNGDNTVFSEGSGLSQPRSTADLNGILSIWDTLSYYAIPIDSPLVENYLRRVMDMVYDKLLTEPRYLSRIIAMLNTIPRDLQLRVNMGVIHKREWVGCGRLGYIDTILSSVYKSGIPQQIYTNPYNKYRIIPMGEPMQGDFLIWWNVGGREERPSSVCRILFTTSDTIECYRRSSTEEEIRYSFSKSEGNMTVVVDDGIHSIQRITGFTIIRR